MAMNLFLLLAIVVLSLAPLAGYQGGWAHFELDNINSSIMVQLGLAPWSHSIDVGYNKVMRLWAANLCSDPMLLLSGLLRCSFSCSCSCRHVCVMSVWR